MSYPEWLRRYTNAESVHTCGKRVWQVGPYLTATDSKALLLVEGEGGHDLSRAKLGTDKADGWIPRLVEVAGEAKRPDAKATTLGDLWAWLDRVEREVCPACGGAGEVPAYDTVGRNYYGPSFACGDCGGRRWVWPYHEDDRDTVALDGWHFDRNALAWWLAAEIGAPESPVRYQVTQSPHQNGVHWLALFGANWKLLMSGFAKDSRCVKAGRKYRTYTPGAGDWWQARRQFAPEVHPGTDWFVEERGYEPGDLASMWGVQVTTEGVVTA